MKKDKDKRWKGRFITSVLWKSVAFSIALILLLLILFFVLAWNAGKNQGMPYIKTLKTEFSETDLADYDFIDVERVLGDQGYVQILDEDYRVIYSSDKSRSIDQYEDFEINYIDGTDVLSMISVEGYKQPDGSVEQVISVFSYTESGELIHNDVYAVDENLNVLYSTSHKNKKKLTEREYQFLTDNLSNRYTVAKTEFKDLDGNSRTLLVFGEKGFRTVFDRIRHSYLVLALEFLTAYIVIAFLFSFWISRRVKKPLTMLNQAMDEISSGGRGTVVQYTGPKEFVEICDNFNEMSLALKQSEENNRKLQEEKQKLIADISHDLKTPVTVIKGYTKAICDGLVEPSEREKYLKIIYQRSEEVTELINEFHEYTKLDHPDHALIKEPVDLCEFVREYFAGRYNEFMIEGYGLEIDLDEDRKYMVWLDTRKFVKVLDNITSNFFKYTPEGSVFYCRIEEQKGSAKLILADNGKGIPPHIRDTIFEPFIVGEKSRAAGASGSGLGLALVKKIVEGHQGAIRLAEEGELGSLLSDSGEIILSTGFVITLPLVQHFE